MADLPVDPSSGYCNKTGIDYSKRKPLHIPQHEYLSLPSFVSHQTHSGKIAYVDSATGYQIAFPQLWQSVRSLAAGLAEMGINKGDVILILSPNSVYFPIISMAIMSVGAIVITTNPLNTAVEIRKQIRDSSSVMAFVAPLLVNKLADANLPLVLISKMPGLSQETTKNGGSSGTMYLGDLMETGPAKAPNVRIKQDDTATLLYSSGTTGLSKGVISTHRNLISMVSVLINRFKLSTTSDNCFLCTVPMFHIYGVAAFACGLLATGSTIVVLSKFELGEMLGAIDKYKVTYLPLVPPILLVLTKTEIAKKYDLKSLHSVTCAAVPLSKELTEEFISRFPSVTLMLGYGLTETTATGASTYSQEESRHYGTAGKDCGS